MKEGIDEILHQYDDEIKSVEQNSLNDFTNVENGIKISRKYIQELRILLRDKSFNSIEDEINFFKLQKPHIYSRLKFFAKLYHFLLQKPAGRIKSQRQFIDKEIQKLQQHKERNLDFVKYYRENSTFLDKYYFVRGNDNIILASDTSHFYTDQKFSTSHDNMIAKIKAYDLLVNHYQQELLSLRQLEKFEQNSKNRPRHYTSNCLKWTASKTDLIELIYALQSSGAIEDGMAGIKEMASICEEIFNIELGNYY